TLLIAGCVLAVAGSVMLMAELAETDRSRAYFGTDARVHTILVGALLALVLHRLPPVVGSAARIVRALGVVSLTLLGVSFVVVSDSGAWFYQGGSMLVAVAVALVIADGVSGSPSLASVLLGWTPLRGLGQISYGLYLWHWPMIVWLTPERLGTDDLALDAIRVVATFFCALVSYVIVEQPIRHRSPTPIAALRAVSVAMTLTGLAIIVGTAGSTTNPLDRDADFEIAEAAPSTSTASGSPSSTTEPLPASSGTDTATSTTIGPERIESIALVGDSVAGTLAPAMRDAFTGAGFTFFDAHVHGCGVVSGLAVDEAGEPFPWSGECVERVPVLHEQLIREHDPDLVIWHSTWETADRLLDEALLRFGTPDHDAALAREIDIVVERLNARGAEVVILVAPPNAPSSFVADPDPTKMLHLADQLAIAADRLDALSLVDLNPIVCPGGPPCPERIEGLTLRPDGGHYSDEAAVWLVAQLADALPIG
ncbi:MAG: acyltransferase family protein, partial [Acidimicrobiales bacterium]